MASSFEVIGDTSDEGFSKHIGTPQRKISFTRVDKSIVETNFRERKDRSLANLPIVGIDGEGYNCDGCHDLANGDICIEKDHHYDLLAACTEEWTEYVEEFPELSAEQIFEFLLSLPEKHGKALFCIFSSTYDFTMWVKRLPKWNQEQLIKTGRTHWVIGPRKGYIIKWRQKREILIYDTSIFERKTITVNNKTKRVKYYPRRIHLYDVFGFFQTSFVKTLRKWQTTDELTIEAIEAMKKQRGTFTPEEKEEVRQYCFLECSLLSKLMLAFREACKEADIVPQHWYGAGALATTLMRKYKVKDYMGPDFTGELLAFMGCAFFGGRTEISYQGRLPEGCVQYDINSAYPTAKVTHPCLEHGQWIHKETAEDFDKYEWGVWRIEWNTHGNLFGPFPWRDDKGSIYYPDKGYGVYHRIEIKAAAKLFGDDCFTLYDGYVWQPECDHRPFGFITERAKYRLKLKAEKKPAHEPLKLGLNSLFGKTAQTVGKDPAYQNFYWAGLTTAITRAKILDCIRLCKGTVYSIATDGLIVSEPIPELSIGPNLGEWDQTNIVEGILIRPGVYKWLDPKGEWHYGTRGFTTDEAKWEEIEALWDSRRVMKPWKYSATRFIGLKQAYLRGQNWRQYVGIWIEEERELSFVPTLGKRSQDLVGVNKYMFPFVARSSFIRLNPHCWCKSDRKLSAMYDKIEDSIREEIDENQP